MIHEVDEAIRGLLQHGALAGADVAVDFDAPTRDWVARLNAPAVNVYLYDIREDTTRRERGTVDVRDEHGIVRSRRQPPRWFRLSYLVTAWTKRAQDEHQLLSAALATLLPHEMLSPSQLPGSLGALGLSVPLTVTGAGSETRSLAEVWSALGKELTPSIDLVVTTPFPSYPDYDAGPPVTEGAVVRAGDLDGETVDAERHHRTRNFTRWNNEENGPGHHTTPGRTR